MAGLAMQYVKPVTLGILVDWLLSALYGIASTVPENKARYPKYRVSSGGKRIRPFFAIWAR